MQLKLRLDGESLRDVLDESSILSSLDHFIEDFPDQDDEVLPGIKWGDRFVLYTPAYWKLQYLMYYYKDNDYINNKLGETVIEEVVACLLGGFGLKSELGMMAYDRLKSRGEIKLGVEYNTINRSLKEPFRVGCKEIKYRFPNKKAKYIYLFLNRNDLLNIQMDNDLVFRNWLMSIDGIGPKTASWITRNHLKSEHVAIIDIHLYRAGLLLGIFPDKSDLQKDYFKLESNFIRFCNAMCVLPSKLDAIIWKQMKDSGRIALTAFNT